MPRKIDHIVYAVPDLNLAMEEFAIKSGASPVFGGYHPHHGTKNALLNLGDGCYLEFLAIDLENKSVTPPRWMGIDMIGAPKITRWSLKSLDLDFDSEIVRAFRPEMGMIIGGSRKLDLGDILRWDMILPLTAPEVELIPFMVDWSRSSKHPTDSLPLECQLISLTLTHPQPDKILQVFKRLSVDTEIKYAESASISMQLNCPNGVVDL